MFGAVTLGMFPSVGVGLLMTTFAYVCVRGACVALDEVELDLVGLGG